MVRTNGAVRMLNRTKCPRYSLHLLAVAYTEGTGTCHVRPSGRCAEFLAESGPCSVGAMPRA